MLIDRPTLLCTGVNLSLGATQNGIGLALRF